VYGTKQEHQFFSYEFDEGTAIPIQSFLQFFCPRFSSESPPVGVCGVEDVASFVQHIGGMADVQAFQNIEYLFFLIL
jgi:hypothetical protein